jgi:hypothetical protein
MRRAAVVLALAFGFSVLMSAGPVAAQEEGEEGHLFYVMTFKGVMPEDGSEEERDALLKEYIEAVTKKNEKIISEIYLVHYVGSDDRDWVVVTEYATWADMGEADKISEELIEKKWPDKKERDEFLKKLGRYFPGHSDEIYTELPEFRK